MTNVKDRFIRWIIKNEVCNKDKKLAVDDNTVISIDKGCKLLEQLSDKVINNNRFNKSIFEIKNYKEAKLFIDLVYYEEGKYIRGRKQHCIYYYLLSLFLKFEYTTFEKKSDCLDNAVYNFNHEDVDLSNIYIFSEILYSELCKWPYVYTVVDNNNKYVKITINKGHDMVCTPIYTDKGLVDEKYLNKDYKIKKEKLNLFLKKVDHDEEFISSAIVINPNSENDKIFIDVEEAWWYYYPEVSNYF